MKKIFVALMVILALALVAGCSINYTAANGKLAYGDMPGKAVGEFSAKGRLTYILHPSIFTLGDKTNENLDALIETEVAAAGGRGANNITITHGVDFMSFLIAQITGGLFHMDYIEVTGQVLK